MITRLITGEIKKIYIMTYFPEPYSGIIILLLKTNICYRLKIIQQYKNIPQLSMCFLCKKTKVIKS